MTSVKAESYVIVAGHRYTPGDLIPVDQFRRDDILQKMIERGIVSEVRDDAGEFPDERSDKDPQD